MAQAQVSFNKQRVPGEYIPISLYQPYRHPDVIVESGALQYVRLPSLQEFPNLVTSIYTKSFKLSGSQLEAVAFDNQAHAKLLPSGERRGFVIGDGAGTGKGRTIAGIIMNNYRCGRRKSVWVSVSPDLKVDAIRDMRDIYAGEERATPVSIFKPPAIEKSIDRTRGVLFCTYKLLSGVKLVNGLKRSRIDQIVEWVGKAFDGAIIFDEAHKAKGGVFSLVGRSVLKLQELLPNARITYVSATLASDPGDLCYMTRLGLWGSGSPFSSFVDLCQFISKRGTAAIELLPVELKSQGMLLARTLAMTEVKYDVISIEETKEFNKLYNDCCVMWTLMFLAVKEFDNNTQWNLRSQFWARHQSFFRHLCVSSKLSHVIRLTKSELKENKAVIIGLESTGEAAVQRLRLSKYHTIIEECSTMRMLVEEFLLSKNGLGIPAEDLGLIVKQKVDPRGPKIAYITSRNIKRKKSNLESLTAKRFKPIDGKFLSSSEDSDSSDDEDESYMPLDYDEVLNLEDGGDELRAKICTHFKYLKKRLPRNSLDSIISRLGGESNVAELTGRVHGQRFSGNQRATLKTTRDITQRGINVLEQRRFNNGDVFTAVISQAASTGISLHSSRKFKNQRQRSHIVLELPWSATNAVQQLGRSHRANQLLPPEIKLVMSPVPGEKRFSSSVSRKIQGMGAICKGDSNCERNSLWEACSVDEAFATPGLRILLNAIKGKKTKFRLFNDGNEHLRSAYFEYASSVGIFDHEKEINPKCFKLDKFLNRILGLPIRIQKVFVRWLDKLINDLKSEAVENGTSEAGIADLNLITVGKREWQSLETFKLPSGRKTELYLYSIVNGCNWQSLQELRSDWVYFKENVNKKSGNAEVVAAYSEQNPCDSTKSYFMVHRPYLNAATIEPGFPGDQYCPIDEGLAFKMWSDEYDYLTLSNANGKPNCLHAFKSQCRSKPEIPCKHPKIISNAGLLYLNGFESMHYLEDVLPSPTIVKVKDNKYSLVGINVPPNKINVVREKLRKVA